MPGLPLTDYSPSFSYTLQIRQKLNFLNPIIHSLSKTYHAPYEGYEFVSVQEAKYIRYRQLDNTSITLWSTARYFDKQKSSIELIWELSDCGTDNIKFESETYERKVRVKILNNCDYPIQYLGLVKLPPLRSDTLYTIEDSAPKLKLSGYIEIQTDSSYARQLEVNFPFIIKLPQRTLLIFDIYILDKPPKISVPDISQLEALKGLPQ